MPQQKTHFFKSHESSQLMNVVSGVRQHTLLTIDEANS
jgi:hypothetical protein